MKILLTAINAKFIHSSLAIRCLGAYAKKYKEHIKLCEYTINNQEEYILKDIYEKNPDAVCFSCYIWNIEMVKSIAACIKKVLPKCVILCGGPEVSYDSAQFLGENPQIDMVICGEGEKPFLSFAEYMLGKREINEVNNLVYKNNGQICANPICTPASLDEIPFVYEDLVGFENKIIYYETQRGCPYNCQFCLSSVEKGVHFLSEERVLSDLQFFLDHKVKQVKFVDRTFNCNINHALSIWKYIMEHDNGVTNFHMEIEAHILTEETIEFLKNAREDLFQFEIGIQSTNADTLGAVKRNIEFESLKKTILKIKEGGNIHVHLDLIAGLPYEGYESFKKSFNDVYSIFPQQLQLGFLKLLKGSGLRRDAEKYGIVFNPKAPYEVLCTSALSFGEMLKLKSIEELVELYYNSGKTVNTERFVSQLFKSPFEFYEEFSTYWEKMEYHRVNHSKAQLYDIFYKFCGNRAECGVYINEIKQLLKLDMLLSDNLKSLSPWVDADNSEETKRRKRDFYNNAQLVEKYIPSLKEYTASQLSRMCRIEEFDIDVFGFLKGGRSLKKVKKAALINYYSRDIITNNANIIDITEDF